MKMKWWLHKIYQNGENVFNKMNFRALEKVLEKYEYGDYFSNLKVNTFHFRKDFLSIEKLHKRTMFR